VVRLLAPQKAVERTSRQCPQLLGIDEHFFTRRHGYATTFCDLNNRKVHDVVLGRSEASLEDYLRHLEGKAQVKVVCMDLATCYRALVRRHFPQARIVADRFHVIRLVNHHFLACWKELDPVGSKHRGLVKLMRRHRHTLTPEQQQRLAEYLQKHPLLELVYRFKQKLCYLLLNKNRNQHRCRKLAPRLLRMIAQLRQSPLTPLIQLGNTLHSWREEIATCGGSPATTASPRDSTPKWRSYKGKPTASATSTITAYGLKYCVLEISRRFTAPINCVEPGIDSNGGRAGTRTPDLLRVKQAL
jgi:transposase